MHALAPPTQLFAPVAFDVTLQRAGHAIAAPERHITVTGHASYEKASWWVVALPQGLAPGSDYQLSAASASGPLIQSQTLPFSIINPNAATPAWPIYE